MLGSTLRLVRPIATYQSKRALTQTIKTQLSAVKMSDFTRLLPELGPPTPAEIPRAIRDIVRLFRERKWQHLTMRQAWINGLVTTEVICWFFLGECIGKGTLIGYQV